MDETGTLQQLASELSPEERDALLDKLNLKTDLAPAVLYEDWPDDGPVRNVEEVYGAIPWYLKIWYSLLGLVSGRVPVRAYEDRLFVRLGKHISGIAPGIYDYEKSLFLPDFYTALTLLKEGARFFYTALDAGFNQDRGAFYAFLGSLEIPEIHRRLCDETNPGDILKKYPYSQEAQLRQLASHAMEDCLQGITEEGRKAMYEETRSLYCLKELSTFLYDRVLMAFAFNSAAGGMACQTALIKDPLERLSGILFSLKNPPSLALLKSLFVFMLQERSDTSEGTIRNLTAQAESALAAIRAFNKKIPLAQILRCGGRDLGWSPKTISGGEDWFVGYREYWKRRVDSQVSAYLRIRRQEELTAAFASFFGDAEFRYLKYAASDSNPQGVPVRGGLCLSFLLTYYTNVLLKEDHQCLRPILITGNFYNRENRTDFTENYNDLNRLEERILKFDSRLAETGELGRRYYTIVRDASPAQVKRRRLQTVEEDITEEAGQIISHTKENIGGMIDILRGLLQMGGREYQYDTLSNMDDMITKYKGFTANLEECVEQFQRVLKLMADIDAVEQT